MNTNTSSIADRDLSKEAPHSPRDRFGGFAILGRTVDKCRASINGKVGEYHYDCPLDNQLFTFKGINGEQFKKIVQSSKTCEDVAKWLQANGTPKTEQEIRAWSDKVEGAKLKEVMAHKSPDELQQVRRSCEEAGVNFESATLFDWLEADDKHSFHAAMAH
jgi:hypothetical protein